MEDNLLDRHDKMQRLKKSDGINPYYKRHDRDSNAVASLMLIMIGVVIGIVLLATLRACDKQTTPQPALRKADACSACQNRTAAMTEYFRKAGSESPEQMALAVLKTKSPRLLAAVAKVESGGNPHIRKGGYKKRHAGAFQVNGRIHGPVSRNPDEQALQAERILVELTTDHGIKKGLSVYGGDSSSRYQKMILAELVRVP